jgi:hypothetical protein
VHGSDFPCAYAQLLSIRCAQKHNNFNHTFISCEGCERFAKKSGNQAAAKYYGYFANQYGEQAVFIYDYHTHEASVWMGDTGWDDVHRVVDGRVEGVILNESEAAWIRACWLAAAKAH